jgi:hypothetical protein
MRTRVTFSVAEVIPDKEAVLEGQGRSPAERILPLLEQAMEIFTQEVRPIGLLSEIGIPEFEDVFHGEGRNDPEAPLGGIFRKAAHLSLFAVTLGDGVSQRISELFASGDYALGYLLDAAASAGADKASKKMVEFYRDLLAKQDVLMSDMEVMDYSPGYCGWHISGQKKLFQTLHPEEVGIALNESFLMLPLKSVSGVLVAGKPKIHEFDPSFAFCRECRTQTCRARMRRVKSS